MPAQTIVTNLGTTIIGNVLQPEWITTSTNDILNKENNVVDLHFSENETISIPLLDVGWADRAWSAVCQVRRYSGRP